MSNIKATKAGLKSFVRSMSAIPYRSLVRDSWKFSLDDFWNYQKKRFQEVYTHARNFVPYYQERINLYPPFDEGYDLLEFLSELPIINKQILREYNEKFWSTKRGRFVTYHTTSGTSGTPLKLCASLSERSLAEAIFEQWMLQLIGQRRPKALYLSGFMTPSKGDVLVWNDLVWGHAYLSIYSLNDANRDKVANILEHVRPQLIYGYASAVNQLAQLFRHRPYVFKNQTIAVVTSEVLRPDWRATMESVLCTKVYDMYGSQEGSHRVLQVENSDLHIEPLTGIIEILDNQNKRSAAGEEGRVVVTGLKGSTMPLIRYDIGDTAVSTGYAVPERGLQWPTIGAIEGRSEDLIRTRDGRHIGYLNFHATKNLSGIKESQTIQVDYEKFILNIVLEAGSEHLRSSIEIAIREEFEKRLRFSPEIEFCYVDEIPRSARGKFRAVVVDFNKSRD